MQEGDGTVVLALAEQVQALQAGNLGFELVAELLLSPREEAAQRQSVVEALVLVGNERGDLGVRNRGKEHLLGEREHLENVHHLLGADETAVH